MDSIDCVVVEGVLSSDFIARKRMSNAAEVIRAPGMPMKKPDGASLGGKQKPITMKRGPKLAQVGNKTFDISGSPEIRQALFSYRFSECHSQTSVRDGIARRTFGEYGSVLIAQQAAMPACSRRPAGRARRPGGRVVVGSLVRRLCRSRWHRQADCWPAWIRHSSAAHRSE